MQASDRNEGKRQRIPIGPGTRVTLRFTLRLMSGEIVDSTGNKPAAFTVGDGSLLPGFEQAMFGLRAGEREVLDIAAEHGFGLPNPENVHRMNRRQFSRDISLEEGLVVSFADGEKGELPGVITRVQGDSIEVDFNHPLSGKDLAFEVEILDVQQVSNEIVRSS